jgi:hypothetical protein
MPTVAKIKIWELVCRQVTGSNCLLAPAPGFIQNTSSIKKDLLISLLTLLNFHKTVTKPLGSNKHNLCVLQSEQCFFLDNSSACSLPLYEEIPRESEYQLLEASRDSEYHMLEASILPEANSLFLLPGHTKLSCPVPPPPAQPRSNRTFFTFHQRRPATQKGDKGGEPGSIPRGGSGAGVNRRRPVATLDIRKAFQLLFRADFCCYHKRSFA